MDKIVHMGMFGGLTIFLLPVIKEMRDKIQRPVLLTVFLNFLLGGIIEILQGTLTQTRSASFFDLGADVVGSILAVIVYLYLISGTRLERILIR
ncbi:MAG: VanZ family protein [Bacteroidota bacterium]|nr:VanZ family protein [Bacteroidota bacterium]